MGTTTPVTNSAARSDRKDAQGTVDTESVRLWRSEGFPIANGVKCLEPATNSSFQRA